MSVINIKGIDQEAKMSKKAENTKKEVEIMYFNTLINIVLSEKESATDVLDTATYMWSHGLLRKMEGWMKDKGFTFGFNCSEKKYNSIRRTFNVDKCDVTLEYYPEKGMVEFDWNGHGMCECYSSLEKDYFIDSLRFKKHGYIDSLKEFSTGIGAFISSFIDWCNEF